MNLIPSLAFLSAPVFPAVKSADANSMGPFLIQMLSLHALLI
jgi:hypothetical protein